MLTTALLSSPYKLFSFSRWESVERGPGGRDDGGLPNPVCLREKRSTGSHGNNGDTNLLINEISPLDGSFVQ